MLHYGIPFYVLSFTLIVMYDSNKIFTENTFEVNLYAFYCNILYHVPLHKLSLFFYFAFENLRFPRYQIPKKLLDTEQNSWTRSSGIILTKDWQPPSFVPWKRESHIPFPLLFVCYSEEFEFWKKKNPEEKKSYEKKFTRNKRLKKPSRHPDLVVSSNNPHTVFPGLVGSHCSLF